MNVLVTGARGLIGRLIGPHLRAAGLTVRGFDARIPRGRGAPRDDLNNLPALRRAIRGCETVLHLAGCADDAADFSTRLLPANITGTRQLFEAARLERVKRVVFASSVQVVAGLIGRRKVRVTDRAPANLYALTKLWGEELGRMYSELHGIEFIGARVGWVLRDTSERAEMQAMPGGRRWVLEPDDARDFFLRSVTVDFSGAAIVYAVSRPGAAWFDLAPARRLLHFTPGAPNGRATTHL